MTAQAGERYRCSDLSCGCEIEITIPSAAQDDGDDDVMGSANDRSIVGSLSSTDLTSQRHPEARAISTPGDYGFQEPGGEGLYASRGNQPAAASGRPGVGESNFKSISSNCSDPTGSSTEESVFSCCCGQPMRKSSSCGHSSGRKMA